MLFFNHFNYQPNLFTAILRPKPTGGGNRNNNNRFQPRQQNDGTKINGQIRAQFVRLIEPDGTNDVVSIREALTRAEELHLDLVEVSPMADPPVCKIIDFGKYRYEQQKKEKDNKKKQHVVVLKEIRFRPHTDTHDFDFKLKHAKEFLEEGNKVKAWVQFKGRENAYSEQGLELLTRFNEALAEVAKVDQAPKMEGRRMTTMLSPAKKK